MKVEEMECVNHTKGTDPCALKVIGSNTAQLLGLERIGSIEGKDKVKYPSNIKSLKDKWSLEGRTWDGKQVILVDNEETGRASYMVMSPDGHLGSVED